jgi:hypothetical protein
LRFGLRADSWRAPQPPLARRLAKLVGGADPERARQLDRAPRIQAEIPAEADEIGCELALELVELGDRTGFDQLAEPRLDRTPDAPQLARPSRFNELGDREGRLANGVGGATVGADGVRVAVDELQQHGERIEPIGDLGVVHQPQSPPSRRSLARSVASFVRRWPAPCDERSDDVGVAEAIYEGAFSRPFLHHR